MRFTEEQKQIMLHALRKYGVDSQDDIAIEEMAEQVKMAFYYEFDELIPSIMADKIDELIKEMVGEE